VARRVLTTPPPGGVGLAPCPSPSPLRGEGRVRGSEVRGSEMRGPEMRGPEVNGSAPAPVLALPRLRPPAPAAVTLASGRPVAMRSSRLAGRIVAGVGPWRSSGEWWTTQPWLQDEWDVELADGTLCRLAHDGAAWP